MSSSGSRRGGLLGRHRGRVSKQISPRITTNVERLDVDESYDICVYSNLDIYNTTGDYLQSYVTSRISYSLNKCQKRADSCIAKKGEILGDVKRDRCMQEVINTETPLQNDPLIQQK